ncbi:MAG: PKD domain-containing protein [Cellvibrionaceae bacterium]
MRLLQLIFFSFLISGCGGSGGTSKDASFTDTSPQPDENPNYTLGGKASGLNGSVVISNGNETITVSKDGNFSFSSNFKKSDSYDLNIDTLPENQLCKIKNSSNTIAADTFDVEIECVSLKEIVVDLSDPALDSLDLKVKSNFDGKGGIGEELITGKSITLATYSNSFLSVVDSNDNLLYISFVNDLSQSSYPLNSHSTAIALMFLEPSIVLSVLDRKFSDEDVKEFIDYVNASSEAKELAATIDRLIESEGYLNLKNLALKRQIIANLNNMLLLAVQYLEAIALPDLYIPGKGVELLTGIGFRKIQENKSSLKFEAENFRYRAVNLLSKEKAQKSIPSQLLTKNKKIEFEISKPIISSGYETSIVGPGNKGNLQIGNENIYIEASVKTALEQYIIRSLGLMIGMVESDDFSLTECFQKEESILVDYIVKYHTNKISLLDLNYQKSFREIFNAIKNDFIISTPNTNETITKASDIFGKLFSCKKFSIGPYSSNALKKLIGFDNISIISQLTSDIYKPDDESLDLIKRSNLHYLGASIIESSIDATWMLNNDFSFSINTSSDKNIAGRPVSLFGNCRDTTTLEDIQCNIDWSFGDGTIGEGGAVSHIYSSPGEYSVESTATSQSGAINSQTYLINILSPEPNLRAMTNQGLNIANSGTAIEFGEVRFGQTSKKYFTVLNEGSSNLFIDNVYFKKDGILQTDFDFSESIVLPISLIAKDQKEISVTFSPIPNNNQYYSSAINIESNDVETPIFTSYIRGTGISELTQSKKENGLLSKSNRRIYANRTDSVIYKSSENSLQFKIYLHETKKYPQLIISLNNYDPSSNPEKNGDYDLSGANNFCSAWLVNSIKSEDQYCTNSQHNDGNFGGTVNISDIGIDYKLVAFELDTVQLSTSCISNCDSITLDGVLALPTYVLP